MKTADTHVRRLYPGLVNQAQFVYCTNRGSRSPNADLLYSFYTEYWNAQQD